MGMDDIYEVRAQVAKALAHPTRLRIIQLLKGQSEVCVCDIAKELSEGQPTVSKHLNVLRNAGLLESRKDGLMVFYRLRAPCIVGIFECLDKVILNDLHKKQAGFIEEETE
jgi:ArsR family transcriptional regulator